MPKRAIYLLSPVQRKGTVFLPMIRFTTVAEAIDFSGIDALMFTSKQAVKVADQIDQKWKKYPSIAIGNATKKQIEDLGGKVIYQPQRFYGKALSQDIAMFFRERKILYLRPNEVSFDAKTFLAKQGIELFEQIIYKTICVKYDKEEMPQKDAVIIFTSPSTIHCFFRNFSWDSSYTAVVIGEATKVHLPKGVPCAVAKEPLIASCIEKAEEILLSSNSK